MAIDYDAWAEKYDETRGVSPSVLGLLLEARGPLRVGTAPGPDVTGAGKLRKL